MNARAPSKSGSSSLFNWQPRTAEIFRALDLQPSLAKYGTAMTETSFWFQNGSKLERSKMSPGSEIINATIYPYVVDMHQDLTESVFFKDLALRYISVDRPVVYIDHRDSDNKEYPLTCRLKDLVSGMTEEVPVK